VPRQGRRHQGVGARCGPIEGGGVGRPGIAAPKTRSSSHLAPSLAPSLPPRPPTSVRASHTSHTSPPSYLGQGLLEMIHQNMSDWVMEFVADIRQLKPRLNLPSPSPPAAGGGGGGPTTTSGTSGTSGARRRPVSALPTPTGTGSGAGGGSGDDDGAYGGGVGELQLVLRRAGSAGGGGTRAADIEDDATSAERPAGSVEGEFTQSPDDGSGGQRRCSTSHEVRRYNWCTFMDRRGLDPIRSDHSHIHSHVDPTPAPDPVSSPPCCRVVVVCAR